jgi:hypothetical protein
MTSIYSRIPKCAKSLFSVYEQFSLVLEKPISIFYEKTIMGK